MRGKFIFILLCKLSLRSRSNRLQIIFQPGVWQPCNDVTMLLFWLGIGSCDSCTEICGSIGTCDEMLHLRLFTMSSVHKSARLNMPKWLTFTSIFIRLPAHFSNKCISISKHEHSMVIHIESLMRVNLHNTGKYLHKHIQILANQQPIPTVK